MPNINPMRDINEHEVVNLYANSGAVFPKGTIVKIASGWSHDRGTPVPVGNAGATYPGTANPRYVMPANVAPVNGIFAGVGTGANHDAFGITLLDIRETDENGERLLYHRQSQYERNWCLSGLAVPILTRGIIMYSGIDPNSVVVGGTKLYPTGDATAGGGMFGLTAVVGGTPVATALGPKAPDGYALLKFHFQ